jgi:Bax inhibitor 1
MRKALYGMGIIGLGLSAAPLIGFANMMNPTILPTALGLTAALFGGASMAAYRMPKDSLLSYGRILGGSLLGLIGLQLVGLGSLYFVGMNPFATMLLNTSTYVSVGLFTAFIAYDTHVAVRMYE